VAVSVWNAENCRRSKNFLSKIDKRIQASTIDASWPQNDIHMRNATQTSSLLPILWGKPVPVHSSELHELPQDNIIGPSLTHLEIAASTIRDTDALTAASTDPSTVRPHLGEALYRVAEV
jgi:hypothetical protein